MYMRRSFVSTYTTAHVWVLFHPAYGAHRPIAFFLNFDIILHIFCDQQVFYYINFGCYRVVTKTDFITFCDSSVGRVSLGIGDPSARPERWREVGSRNFSTEKYL